ncbi:MAG: N-sulfoglucosamine sulfohydrolase [Candidatus Binatia bacterium]|jgi:N-sulfoglucosamine sulfohydrolase
MFRNFRNVVFVGLLTMAFTASSADAARPNILFAIADDWGWPHAGAYGDPVVKTPAFDRIAKEGVLFEHAYISSPSCTPSRNAILTGQYHWRLGPGANLWSTLDTEHRTYPLILEEAGYFVGHWRKSWGPGSLKNWGEVHPAGKKFKNFDAFLTERPKDKPFCFWLGASDPHRPYKAGTGVESGMDLNKIKLFDHYPDSKEIRSDVADYYFEVQRFDNDVAVAMAKLEKAGLLENTIVVMTGDHGMPFPRCKGNLYDSGARVPLAIRWPGAGKPGRVVEDFVSTTDLAPSFLEVAGVEKLAAMTGRSLMPILKSGKAGRIETKRDHVLFGKERHVAAQEAPDSGGTPMRGIRNYDYLLIRNYRPDRWPAGTPNFKKAFLPGTWLGDCDNGPTKTYMVDSRGGDARHRKMYDLAFGKRRAIELYDVKADPAQMNNIAYNAANRKLVQTLLKQMTDELTASEDPRTRDGADHFFDTPPYLGGGPRHPDYIALKKRMDAVREKSQGQKKKK